MSYENMIEPFKSRAIWRDKVFKMCKDCEHFENPMGYYSCKRHKNYCEEIRKCGLRKE